MLDYQNIVFNWVSAQHWSTALVIFVCGLIYAFQGFRLFRLLLAVSSAVFGALLGAIAAPHVDQPPELGAVAVGLGFLALGICVEHASVLLLCAGVWGILGHYVALQLGLADVAAFAVLVLLGGLGALFARLCNRTMRVMLTVQQGTVLMVIGFAGMAVRLLPSVGDTFIAWSNRSSLLIPILLGVLFVTGYSVQSSAQRGDIRTG
ncbi:MAG: hypothetical protein CHACPFDD_03855 [Phycisphaerae bacterium]|nr:hypothetical protein [Phycisphaerae bacterium]